MPVLTETQLSRADIYKGLVNAYVLVRKHAWQHKFEEGGFVACLHVLRRIEEAMEDHWAKGTAFDLTQRR
jgi:hypothetical protein